MRMIYGFILLFLSMAAFSASDSAQGGIYLGTTRVVFNSNAKAAVFTANNSSSADTWLIRSWVAPYGNSEKEPSEANAVDNFVITPPLHRLDPNASVQLRVNRAGGALPENRESVFYINVLAIPPKPKEAKGSVIQFALNTQIKLFYRPEALNDERELVKAYGDVTVKADGSTLTLSNPSPYYLTLTNVVLNGSVTLTPADPMIPPFSSVAVNATAKSGSVSYQAINDYGGKTNQVNVIF